MLTRTIQGFVTGNRALSRVLSALLVVAILAGLWLLFLRNALDGTTSFAVFMDNEFFIGPVLSSMSDSLQSGVWPLRMDTILGGVPLYNFTQLTPYYPLYLLPLPLYETPLQAIHSMHMLVLLHLLIMEINTYLFLRVLGASRLAAVTGAVLIVFSANSFSYAVWLNIVAPYAWFPLFLAGMLGLAQGRSLRTYAAMTWVGIVMLTLASPAQPLIHAVFTAAVFSGFRTWQAIRQRDAGVIPGFIAPMAGLAILSLMVVAPVLGPALRDLPGMIRWIGSFPAVYGNERIPFAAFEAEQLALAHMGGVLFKIRGVAVGQQFVGLIVAALALIKIFSPQRNWMVNALVFIALYSLVSAFGSNLGLGYLNYRIPLLNLIREPSRFLFLFQFATAALAVLAIDELRQSTRLVKRQWLVLAALAGAAIVILLLFREQLVATVPPGLALGLLLLLVILSWLIPRLAFANAGLVLASVWSVAALATLAVEVPWLPPAVTRSLYVTEDLAQLDVALQRITELDPAHDYRVIFDGGINIQTAAMLASHHGIRTLNANFNPAPRRQFEELYYHGARGDNYARVLGAKFLLCKDCSLQAVQGFSFAESIAGYNLYTTTDVLPHSYASTHISGDSANLGEFAVKAATLPLDTTFLFVETAQRPLLQELEANGPDVTACTSSELHRDVNKVSIQVECGSPGVLVLNKFNDLHWRVQVDGNTAQTLNVNGNQVGVQVPTGIHRVDFRYQSRALRWSLYVAALGLLMSLGLACWRRTPTLSWTGRL